MRGSRWDSAYCFNTAVDCYPDDLVFMRKLIFIFSIFVPMTFCSLELWAQDPRPQLTLSSDDRVLVIAPHPDDEVIGAGGVIQEALRLNIPVRVMYVTNGDSNSLSFLYYKKHPVFGRRQAFEMGKLRQKEAGEALKHLGLEESDSIFLGYPDYGTLNIFMKYWKSNKPYRSVLTRVSRVPYPISLTPEADYNAPNILADFKKVLSEFRPTKIFVTHPADGNADHQAAYLFLKIALWDQDWAGQISVYTYLVHAHNWPRPLGLYPQLRLDPQQHLQFQGNQWFDFELNQDQLKRKEEAIRYYRTQIPYKPKYLFTFVRANELFASVFELDLSPQVLNAATWEKEEKKQYACINGKCGDRQRDLFLKSVVYALGPEQLSVRIKLNQRSRQDFNIDLYLFGYAKNVPFARMPKVHMRIGQDLNVVILDEKKYMRSRDVRLSQNGNDVLISVPRAFLGHPQKLIGAVALQIQNLPLEASTWTVMEINDGS
jgi:LmbE family N-acetylglucosaminyl deacetylase